MLARRSSDAIEPGHELARRCVEGASKPDDDGERGVADAALDLGHVREADTGPLREVCLRELLALPQFAHPGPEGAAHALVPVVGHVRIVRTTITGRRSRRGQDARQDQ